MYSQFQSPITINFVWHVYHKNLNSLCFQTNCQKQTHTNCKGLLQIQTHKSVRNIRSRAQWMLKSKNLIFAPLPPTTSFRGLPFCFISHLLPLSFSLSLSLSPFYNYKWEVARFIIGDISIIKNIFGKWKILKRNVWSEVR